MFKFLFIKLTSINLQGVNSISGKTWEEELCADSQARGVAVLGDSISAHFHLPPQWLDATQISVVSFEFL